MQTRLNTFIVSDMHLTEAHEPDEARPLWMAYKRREFYIDEEFAAFLEHIERKGRRPDRARFSTATFSTSTPLQRCRARTATSSGSSERGGLEARNGRASSR